MWAVAREQDYTLSSKTHFKGLKKGSYSFLLVCHHWFEVASKTPDVWGFWGNDLQGWEKRCCRYKTASVDLILDGCDSLPAVSTRLKDALIDRAARDKIRQIHLQCTVRNLPSFILSTLTPDEEGVWKKSIESIVLQTITIPEELSSFFARSRLPWLQCLQFTGTLQTPLWDHLTSQTTRLTTLSLQLFRSSLPPTASQLISILVSNPYLQHLRLWHASLPDDTDESGIRVPLRHLKRLVLGGKFPSVFRLLQCLELPTTLDQTSLHMEGPTLKDIYQTLGPYMRNHVQHDTRLRHRLSVNTFGDDYITKISIDRADNCLELEQPSELSRGLEVSITGLPPNKKLPLDLIEFIPQERVEFLKMEHTLEVPETFFIAMPRLKSLWINNVTLLDGFMLSDPKGSHAGRKLLPSLQILSLVDVTVEDDNWEPLITYLAHQTADGQTISLRLENCGTSDMCPKVEKKIKSLVEKLDCCIALNDL
jgi:hypothetical protein